MAEYVNNYGYILTDVVYKDYSEYVRLKNTNRLHKLYYTSNGNPYIKINGLRYHLDEFIQASF